MKVSKFGLLDLRDELLTDCTNGSKMITKTFFSATNSINVNITDLSFATHFDVQYE